MIRHHPVRISLAGAIAMALLLKALFLYELWKTCFAKPQATRMHMPTAQVEQHMLADGQPTTSLQHPPTSKGER